MVQITTSAAQHLARVRDERGLGGQSARLVAKDGGVRLTFTTDPAPGDQRVDAAGMSLFIASEVAGRLEGSTIDTQPEGDRAALVIRGRPASRPS
jgi:Fe-S cluster assembly iron-binding protein IscA